MVTIQAVKLKPEFLKWKHIMKIWPVTNLVAKNLSQQL